MQANIDFFEEKTSPRYESSSKLLMVDNNPLLDVTSTDYKVHSDEDSN